MQVSLEDILTSLLSKVESLEATVDDLRVKSNVLFRLYKEQNDDDEIDKEAIKNAVKEEFEISKKAGLINENSSIDEAVDNVTDGLIKWLEGDVEEIRKRMEEYRKKVKEAMDNDNVIDVAPANFVNQLKGNQQRKNNDDNKLIY
ncbi:MAG: hypothetical protein FXF54_04050 [Kosmotoga sp.]|nr:MAG: hypothetical protein FXF54_04050 [Kosmotoga sp.]